MSVVAIAKDEGLYIEEWVAFNRVLGIDHIYLYDNGSSDEIEKIITSYIDEGYVMYQRISGKKNMEDDLVIERFTKRARFDLRQTSCIRWL